MRKIILFTFVDISYVYFAFACLFVTLGTTHRAFSAQATDEAPIAIDADSLEVIQSENKAIFKGNVVAKQADMTLRARQMVVFYGQREQAKDSAMGSLSRIEVDGNVR